MRNNKKSVRNNIFEIFSVKIQIKSVLNSVKFSVLNFKWKFGTPYFMVCENNFDKADISQGCKTESRFTYINYYGMECKQCSAKVRTVKNM